MDTISHGFAGSILARSAAERPAAVAALVLGAVSAIVPDLDFLFFSNRLDYLRDHRSWTHSFLVLPFMALALALISRIWARQARLPTLWLFAAIGIGSHIVFDWATSFGIMFWTPVTRHRYALDWLFILDPLFTGISLGTLVLTLVFRDRARRIAIFGSGVLASYVALCAVLHARALETWRRLDRPPAGARVAVLPQFLSPFRWLGLSESDGEIRVAFFDIGPFARGVDDPQPPTRWRDVLSSLSDFYPPPARAKIASYEKPPASSPLEAARGLSDWQIYLAFARFPLETVYPEPDGGATVIIQDLRFLPFFVGPWEPDQTQGIRRQPFVYRVRLDASLNAVERGFVRGGR
jgi:inner membrane protein